MGFTAEQIEEIKKIFEEQPLNKRQEDYIEARYVQKCDCEANLKETDRRLSKDYTELSVINTKLNVIIAVMAVIGTAICGVIVKMVF